MKESYDDQVHIHKLRLQQLLEPARGITAKAIDHILGIYPDSYEMGGLWAVNKDNEVTDLATALNIQVNIIEVMEYTDDGGGKQVAGSIEVVNPGEKTAVYIVLSEGQYNPMLQSKPISQGNTGKKIQKNLEKLINTNKLRDLESNPLVRSLYYRQLEGSKHNNNCFYFALAECLSDKGIRDASGEEYTADSLKAILAERYKGLDNPRTQEWLKSIPDESIIKDKAGKFTLNYEKVSSMTKGGKTASIGSDERKCEKKEKQQESSTRKAKTVQGYYSDDDVIILLQALLKKKNIEKSGELREKKMVRS